MITINVFPDATDAVAEPLAINGDACANTFVNWEPSPTNENAVTEPDTSIEPVNSEPISEPVFAVLTINRSPLATDALAEPLAINGDAAATTFVNWEPSPTNENACTLPLTSIEPVNLEPKSEPLNPVLTSNP